MSRRRLKLEGQKFGKLKVIEFAHNDNQGRARFRCACDCGKEAIARGSDLRCGVTQSCGCARGRKTRLSLEGQKFGRLKVIKFAHQDKHGFAKWTCVCTCGKETIVLGISLRSGNTQSCGCKNIEIISSRKGALNPAFKHGHSHKEGQPGSPTYVSWRAMKKRCLDPNAEKWPKYGGANPPIKICERWLGEEGFTNFLTDLGERPKGTTLGRFHDVGDYEPSNVAWMTPMQQRQNWRPDRNPGACQKKAA